SGLIMQILILPSLIMYSTWPGSSRWKMTSPARNVRRLATEFSSRISSSGRSAKNDTCLRYEVSFSVSIFLFPLSFLKISTGASLFSDTLVLDLTSTIRGMHCTKMFADYGAEVILVEPVGGSPARRVGPFAKGQPGLETSLHFAHHNRNKKSITLNLRKTRGQ